MLLFDKIFGTESERYIKKMDKTMQDIQLHKEKCSGMSDEELRAKTSAFKSALESGKTTDDILPEAFAVAGEMAKRKVGMDPFKVQFTGAAVLHNGAVAEMRTGEGKTLVAVPAAYLNALTGDPVHIVTVNDYLARRDAVWMGQIFANLGVTVGVINGQNQSYQYDPGHEEKDAERDEKGGYKVVYEFLREVSRQEAYRCDVVYGTNNEFVFDYLRDNIEYEPDRLRQRGFHFAIVDEADSILIDEARSPLIISAPVNIPASQYVQFAQFAATLKEGEDYIIDEKQRSAAPTPSGMQKLEDALKMQNVYVEGAQRIVHYLQNALRAQSLYKKDKHYVIRDGKVVIVDEFTGRLQPGRQWSEGLHQAIEAKEGVTIQQETRTYASITYQNYFRMYKKLAGMTGTALSSEEEFYKVYKMPVISIPTNKPSQRDDHPDLIFQTHAAKLRATAAKVKELHEKGQPVLVGTASIEHNEELSKRLKRAKIPHEVLNAKNHEREGEIIAQAGKKGMVTIATNLAGRGVDIKLGGADMEEEEHAKHAEEIKNLGGLFVLGTERHESRRVDDQLRGRCGRQGDRGETQFYISLEDDLARVFGSEKVLQMAKRLGLPEDQAVHNRIVSKSIESAQSRIEGHHFDMRRFSLQYDTILNQHRSEVYAKRHSILFAGDEQPLKEYISEEDFEKTREKHPDDAVQQIRRVVLRGIDEAWMEHLELMDYARSSVNLRSYGQREPLMEYKKEGARLFGEFWDHARDTIAKVIKESDTAKEQ